VWVLTRPESKEPIESELTRNPVTTLHFVYVTLPFWRDSARWGISGGMQVHCYLWQIGAYFVARRLHREIGFDFVHHVTFQKYAYPSFLSLLPVPFVWGPVGGGETAPKAFWKDFSFSAKSYELARIVARQLGEVDPFVRLTARRSSLAGATTPETAKCLYRLGARNVEIKVGVGLSEQDIAHLAQYGPPDSSRVRFISIGRLLHWKGVHLGLRAFAEAKLSNAEYWVLGDGPERDRLSALVSALGIARYVTFFLRWMRREEVLARLGESDVLVHPSLHDSGGWVCIEAMAAGCPVVCLDLGGPAVLVTKETGFKIEACNPEQVVRDMTKAMVGLAGDPELRSRMGEAGRKLVQQCYRWRMRGMELDKLYQQIREQAN
ncbi:MAG: glycosyltransferase family 4 protein, partial [Gammaproteobacteria bacterium]